MVAFVALSDAQDTDSDQIPDSWEIANGSDPDVANDDSDFDRDGLSLLQEYESSALGFKPNGLWRATELSLPPEVSGTGGPNFAVTGLNNRRDFGESPCPGQSW